MAVDLVMRTKKDILYFQSHQRNKSKHGLTINSIFFGRLNRVSEFFHYFTCIIEQNKLALYFSGICKSRNYRFKGYFLPHTFLQGVGDHVKKIVHLCCGYPSYLDQTDYLKADPMCYQMTAEKLDEAGFDQSKYREPD